MQHTMEQAVVLGAYAGTVTLPLVRTFGDADAIERASALVSGMWAGLPLVTDSRADPGLDPSGHDHLHTERESADGVAPVTRPADLVPDALDLVRILWEVARNGSPQELAVVSRFRLADLAAGMDHVFAVRTGERTPARPGAFEAIVRECLDLVTQYRAASGAGLLTATELHDHAIAVGEHLVECLLEGTPCRLLTTPQVDLLRLQVVSALNAAGLTVLDRDDEADEDRPGVCLAAIDDVDLTGRCIDLHWHCAPDVQRRCREALRAGDYGAQVLRHSGTVRTTMSDALQRILEAAGFEARIDHEIDEHHVLVTGLVEPERLRVFVNPSSDAGGRTVQ